MKERPILFSAPMVCAILDGRKTMTRRVVKPFTSRIGKSAMPSDVVIESDGFAHRECPYGQPGDRLWVRESFSAVSIGGAGKDFIHYRATPEQGRFDAAGLIFKKWVDAKPDSTTPPFSRWKPSIHMPRWASRITLEVTGVRVERLQNISGADAWAEGIERSEASPIQASTVWSDYASSRLAFMHLWESINGDESWYANPWVWVVEFKRVAQEQAA